MSNIKWVQWTGKTSKQLKAFAVDVDAPLKNNILRAINGSVVPNDAIEAQPDTQRDWFCEQILASENGEPRKAKTPKEPKAPKGPRFKRGKKTSQILVGGVVIASFDSSKLVDGEVDVRVSDKSWAVYQNKKRMTSGKLPAPAVVA